jgi:CBS-domain-containing membrane protein
MGKLQRFIQSKAPARPGNRFILYTMLGALLAIGVLGWLTGISGQPWLMAPFGASCVLVFGVPDSPLAQPRNVIGGHVLSTLVGLLVLQIIGGGWIAGAIAVALAIGVMQWTRTLHAPAGANPLVVLVTQPGWSFLLMPVLIGAGVIVAVALLTNNLRQRGSYPRYWY